MTVIFCSECGGAKRHLDHLDEPVCFGCEPCEHNEHDHGICLDCDEDITDELVGQAEAYWEGDR